MQAHDEIRKDEEYTALSIPDIEGDIPKLFILKSKEGHDEALINALKQTRSEDPEGSIGVLIRNWKLIGVFVCKLFIKRGYVKI